MLLMDGYFESNSAKFSTIVHYYIFQNSFVQVLRPEDGRVTHGLAEVKWTKSHKALTPASSTQKLRLQLQRELGE